MHASHEDVGNTWTGSHKSTYDGATRFPKSTMRLVPLQHNLASACHAHTLSHRHSSWRTHQVSCQLSEDWRRCACLVESDEKATIALWRIHLRRMHIHSYNS